MSAFKADDQLERLVLEKLAEKKTQVTIFLVNGVKLIGQVAAFDTATVALKRDAVVQLVYRNAISTVMPMEPLAIDL